MPSAAVMIAGTGVHGELLVSHAERRLAPRNDLVGLGEGETDGAQAIEGLFSHIDKLAWAGRFVTSRMLVP